MVPKNRRVLLVSDQPERAARLAQGLSVVMPCEVVAFGAPLPTPRPVALIVDCGSDNVADSSWLDDLCAGLDAGTPCLFLSHGGGTHEAALVARLPSPIVISARNGAAGLVSILQQALARPPRENAKSSPDKSSPAAASPERRIETVTKLVGRIFEAAGSGVPPSPVEADEGTEIVLATISEIGVRDFLDIVWRHDFTVYQHSLSVAGYAAAFAAELHFSKGDQHRLTKAALLHDVGKAHIPLAILNKPGPLTPDEMTVMRTHAALGADLLAAAGGFEQDVIDVARWHHERLDGSGYPDGLKASAISDLVRLVAICDVHSALTERRVYRAPMSAEQAGAVMDGMAGQLDPDLLRAYRPILGCVDTADR